MLDDDEITLHVALSHEPQVGYRSNSSCRSESMRKVVTAEQSLFIELTATTQHPRSIAGFTLT